MNRYSVCLCITQGTRGNWKQIVKKRYLTEKNEYILKWICSHGQFRKIGKCNSIKQSLASRISLEVALGTIACLNQVVQQLDIGSSKWNGMKWASLLTPRPPQTWTWCEVSPVIFPVYLPTLTHDTKSHEIIFHLRTAKSVFSDTYHTLDITILLGWDKHFRINIRELKQFVNVINWKTIILWKRETND